MMAYMKYIVVKDDCGDVPVIFHSIIPHNEMLNALRGEKNWKLVSAGFVVHRSEGLECYGSSVTLRVKSRNGEDSELISKLLGVNS